MKPVDIRNANWAEIEGRIEGDRREVYETMRRTGPATTRTLAERMQLDPLSVRPRVTELYQLGLVILTGREGREGVYMAVPISEARDRFLMAKALHAEQMRLAV
jgi:predicted transcriptional regulator